MSPHRRQYRGQISYGSPRIRSMAVHASRTKNGCFESAVAQRHPADWRQRRRYVAQTSDNVDRAGARYSVFQHPRYRMALGEGAARGKVAFRLDDSRQEVIRLASSREFGQNYRGHGLSLLPAPCYTFEASFPLDSAY